MEEHRLKLNPHVIEAILTCKKMDCPIRQKNYPNGCCPYMKEEDSKSDKRRKSKI